MENFDLKKYLAEGKLTEQEEEMDFSYTELTDDEKDMVSDVLGDLYKKINPTHDIKRYTGLFKFIEGWFEAIGGIGSGA